MFIIMLMILLPMIGAVIVWVESSIRKSKQNMREEISVHQSKQSAWGISMAIVAVEFLLSIYLLFIRYYSPGTEQWKLQNICGQGLSFQTSGFQVLYGVLTAGVWLIVTIFSREYFKKDKERDLFYKTMLFILGATMGVFYSGDLFTTFIFFEMMSVAVYFWVIHDKTTEAICASNLYMAFAIASGMVMLMGIFLLYHLTGTLSFSELLESCSLVTDRTMLYVSAVLLLCGFGTKCGVFLFHIWMPSSYLESPTPATILLSSILTKTGIFGLIIINSYILSWDTSWGMITLIAGVLTMAVGAIMAVFSMNLKVILACSSMSQIGFIVVGIGMMNLLKAEGSFAIWGTMLHMVNHTLLKLILFIIAGVICMTTTELDLNNIRGIGKKNPILKFAFLVAMFGMSGVPLWNGYISKSLLHESIVEYISILSISDTDLVGFFRIIEWIFLISGGLTLAYMLKLYIAIFFEDSVNKKREKTCSMSKITSGILIACACFAWILGTLPTVFMNRIARIGDGFISGIGFEEKAIRYFSLSNLSGALISLGIGVLVYFGFIRVFFMRKRKNGGTYYQKIWPEWISLETIFYRPVFYIILPAVLTFLCRILDQLVDGVIVFMRKTIYCDNEKKLPPMIGTQTTYFFGSFFNEAAKVLNKVIFRRHPIKKDYIPIFAKKREKWLENNSLIMRSVSFGLLMACIGLCCTLVYLVFIYI